MLIYNMITELKLARKGGVGNWETRNYWLALRAVKFERGIRKLGLMPDGVSSYLDKEHDHTKYLKFHCTHEGLLGEKKTDLKPFSI